MSGHAEGGRLGLGHAASQHLLSGLCCTAKLPPPELPSTTEQWQRCINEQPLQLWYEGEVSSQHPQPQRIHLQLPQADPPKSCCVVLLPRQALSTRLTPATCRPMSTWPAAWRLPPSSTACPCCSAGTSWTASHEQCGPRWVDSSRTCWHHVTWHNVKRDTAPTAVEPVHRQQLFT